MANRWPKLICCKWAALLSIVQSSVAAPQTSLLQAKIRAIAAEAQGTVAICFQAAPGFGRLA
jgi:hypothetical protein